MERVCTKCGSPVKAERSATRLTLRCTNSQCKNVQIKNIAPLGYG